MHTLLAELLSAEPSSTPLVSVRAWWTRHQARCQSFAEPYHRAVLGGFVSDRLGFAFASGYHEALQQLLRSRQVAVATPGRTVALCASEEGGAHPRAIRCHLRAGGDAFELSGAKRWTTLGAFADELLVVASRGRGDDGRPQLCLVKIPSDREGVVVSDMGPTPFVPEIPHASLSLREVRVEHDEVLPGDGYVDYLKPFRTVEDLHVQGAFFGWLLQVARRSGWPDEVVARLCEHIVAGAALATQPPLSPGVHVALAGLLASSRSLLAESRKLWSDVDGDTRERWLRDQPLLQVAEKARSKRLEAAWRDLGAGSNS